MENFSPEFLDVLASNGVSQKFQSDTILFKKNDIDLSPEGGETMIYFVESGILEVFVESYKNTESHNQVMKTLEQGDCLGIFGFFFNQPRNASARVKTESYLLCYKRENFIKLLKKFPNDYERYCMMRDKVLNENDLTSLKMNCYVCNKYYHTYTHCPKVHYVPDKDRIHQSLIY